MKQIKNIDWPLVWRVFKIYVVPNIGTVILYTAAFLLIGIALYILMVRFLRKKKFFTRQNRQHHWVVKLYYIYFLGVILYFFGHFGFVQGVYKVLNNQKHQLASDLYEKVAGQVFSDSAKRVDFIHQLQYTATDFQESSNVFAIQLKAYVHSKNVGVGSLNKSKNDITDYFLEKYNNDIYTAAVYGMLMAAGKGHVDISKNLSYQDFQQIMHFLLTVDAKQLENSIKTKISGTIGDIMKSQYRTILFSLIGVFMLLMILPFTEYFIYRHRLKNNMT